MFIMTWPHFIRFSCSLPQSFGHSELINTLSLHSVSCWWFSIINQYWVLQWSVFEFRQSWPLQRNTIFLTLTNVSRVICSALRCDRSVLSKSVLLVCIYNGQSNSFDFFSVFFLVVRGLKIGPSFSFFSYLWLPTCLLRRCPILRWHLQHWFLRSLRRRQLRRCRRTGICPVLYTLMHGRWRWCSLQLQRLVRCKFPNLSLVYTVLNHSLLFLQRARLLQHRFVLAWSAGLGRLLLRLHLTRFDRFEPACCVAW